MRLRLEQFYERLARQPLAPLYVLTGDEPFQMQEAADAVRARARALGFAERKVMQAERGFDWQELLAEASARSLFAERRLLDLRLGAKPGDAGAKVLSRYAAEPPADTVLLVSCPRYDSGTQRSKWFQALEKAGVVVPIWPVEPRALPEWITRRMRARGLQPSREAVAVLAERVEGNLLAAAQEVEKLALLHSGRLGVEQVSVAVAESARYNVFALVDAALQGQSARVARMLGALRGEGAAPALVSWALAREVRATAVMAAAAAGGERLEAVLADARVWDRRKPLVRAALRRIPPAHWDRLVQRCGRVERVVKGAAMGNPWDELLQLTLELAGTPLFCARCVAAG